MGNNQNRVEHFEKQATDYVVGKFLYFNFDRIVDNANIADLPQLHHKTIFLPYTVCLSNSTI